MIWARGVPRAQITLIQDRQATRAALIAGLQETLSHTRAGDSLIFYFAGHGIQFEQTSATYFVPYDGCRSPHSLWAVRDVFEAIQSGFRGTEVLLLSDACHSGGVVELARVQTGPIHYWALASTPYYETSTEEWNFGEAVNEALRGEVRVDRNNDGWVSLAELVEYVRREMAFSMEQFAEFQGDPAGARDLRLAPAVGEWQRSAGEQVWARWRTHSYAAKILREEAGSFLVRWVDYEEFADREQWVAGDALTTYYPREFLLQQPIQVRLRSADRWVPAIVLENRYGVHRVRVTDPAREPKEFWIGQSEDIRGTPIHHEETPFSMR